MGKHIKAKYCIANGSAPPHYFTVFAVSNHIGTHGDAPSGYGQLQFNTYTEAKELFDSLDAHWKPYRPVVGIDDEGYSVYVDNSKFADIVHYAHGKGYWTVKKGGADYLYTRYTVLEALEQLGCLDSGLL